MVIVDIICTNIEVMLVTMTFLFSHKGSEIPHHKQLYHHRAVSGL